MELKTKLNTASLHKGNKTGFKTKYEKVNGMTLRGGAHNQQGLRTSFCNLTGNDRHSQVFTIILSRGLSYNIKTRKIEYNKIE